MVQEATSGSPDGQAGAVCVAVLPNEKPVRSFAKTAPELIELLNKSLIAWVDFSVDDLARDGEMVATMLGFSGNLVETLLSGPYSNYDDRDSEVGIRLPMVKIRGIELLTDPLLVLARHDLVLTLHGTATGNRMQRFARYADVFMRKIPADLPPDDKITTILTRLISQNNDRNFEALRQIQAIGDQIGAALAKEDADPDRRRLGQRIYDMKHTLVEYLDVLWASLDVIQSLRHGDAELISDERELLARVGLLGEDVNRQIQLSEHMSQVLISGLEVLQSMYNNELQQLNNRLAGVVAWLTILGTAILVPNTIATVFGGMPAEYGFTRLQYLLLLFVVTGAAVLLAFEWVRRRNLLPKRR